MDELRDLYQATILDHNRKPRNFRTIEAPDRYANGHNPICGDKLVVFLALDDNRVTDVAFQGIGCAISVASASLMTDYARGKTLDEIELEFERFHQMVTSSPNSPLDTQGLGKLAVFSGVREFPMRVKCATLAWHTLRAALDQDADVARTE
ncbi:MAG TPA: SUF system NifU family Fe-S cluster assembly protein [Myxococcales bacterium]|nr:SUF system NifU family Fe-S cluster assembly protein [Myxococcales bacterium]HIL01074.1 SUF system NifU family Fe-S cluster assembly protein [Myxococcales bacterium]